MRCGRTTARLFQNAIAFLLVLVPGVSAFAFSLAGRWTSTATNPSIGPLGNPATVTWSIVPDGTNLDESGEAQSPSSLIEMMDIRFPYPGPISGFPIASPEDLIRGYVNRPWFPIFESAFERLDSLSGLTYLYEPKEDGMPQHISVTRGVLGVRGDARIGGHSFQLGGAPSAFNYYPNYGEMVINTDYLDSYIDPAINYRGFRNLLMHEALHGLGLRHVASGDGQFLMEPGSLRSFDGPQFDEILALHRAYGGREERQGGNDTPATALDLGSLGPGQHLVRGTAGTTTAVAGNETNFLSIDDDSDVDYFRFATQTPARFTIAVTPQGPTYRVGEENGAQQVFDAQRQNDLSLEFFDEQLGLIAIAAQAGLGEGETILSPILAGGTYYIRVSGRHNSAQMYRLDWSAAVPEPAGLVLLGAGLLVCATHCRFPRCIDSGSIDST